MQFTKLFNSILDSTIWQEPKETKIVWITMLAMVDRSGEVHASIPGLARRAGVTIPECELALACLSSPDAYSRTKDHDGIRIAEIDGGWALLNHGKYRALLSAEERREYNRRKQAEYRSKASSNDCLNVKDPCINVKECVSNAHITEAEAEAEAEAEKDSIKTIKNTSAPNGTSSASTREEISWDCQSDFSGITEDDRRRWTEAYPAVNLARQIASASEWLRSNPAKKKKNFRRYLSSWLSRAQEKGGDIKANKPHRAAEYPQEQLELP